MNEATGDVLTFGIEEEFFVVDRRGHLSQAGDDVVDAAEATARRSGRSAARTDPVAGRGRHRRLPDPRRGTAAAARDARGSARAPRAGVGCGCCPPRRRCWPRSGLPIITPNPRYERMAEHFGATARTSHTCGCHVHVAIPDKESGIRVLGRIRPWLPALLTITANSAIADGYDTGYSSWRYQQWSRWPSAGPPPRFASFDEYESIVDGWLRAGSILDRGMIYWDVRLSEKQPTLEFRIADVAATPDEAVLLGVLARGLVATALADDAAPRRNCPNEVLRAQLWRASREGATGCCPHPDSGDLAPTKAVLEDLITLDGARAGSGGRPGLRAGRDDAAGLGGRRRGPPAAPLRGAEPPGRRRRPAHRQRLAQARFEPVEQFERAPGGAGAPGIDDEVDAGGLGGRGPAAAHGGPRRRGTGLRRGRPAARRGRPARARPARLPGRARCRGRCPRRPRRRSRRPSSTGSGSAGRPPPGRAAEAAGASAADRLPARTLVSRHGYEVPRRAFAAKHAPVQTRFRRPERVTGRERPPGRSPPVSDGPPTMGVEEEFLLVNPRTGHTRRRARNRCWPGTTTTARCPTASGCTANCGSPRSRPPAASAPPPTSCATTWRRPAACWPAPRRPRTARCWPPARRSGPGTATPPAASTGRYAEIDAAYGAVVADYEACGCHVHVGVEDRDTAVAVVNHVGRWLPTLLALSVNSPFDHGRDTGYHSWRMVLQSRFPGGGLAPHLRGVRRVPPDGRHPRRLRGSRRPGPDVLARPPVRPVPDGGVPRRRHRADRRPRRAAGAAEPGAGEPGPGRPFSGP